jgi:hypothetical protein
LNLSRTEALYTITLGTNRLVDVDEDGPAVAAVRTRADKLKLRFYL